MTTPTHSPDKQICERCGKPSRNMLDVRTGKRNLYHLHPEDYPLLETAIPTTPADEEVKNNVQVILSILKSEENYEEATDRLLALVKEREAEARREEREWLVKEVKRMKKRVPELTSELFYKDRKGFEMMYHEQTLIEGRNLALQDVLNLLTPKPKEE